MNRLTSLFVAMTALGAGCASVLSWDPLPGDYEVRSDQSIPGPESPLRAELSRIRIGVGPFRHLYERGGQVHGSGLDESEEIVARLREMEIFGDVSPTDDPGDPSFDYVIHAALQFDPSSRRLGCRLAIRDRAAVRFEGPLPITPEGAEAMSGGQIVGPPPEAVSDLRLLGRAIGEIGAAKILEMEAASKRGRE